MNQISTLVFCLLSAAVLSAQAPRSDERAIRAARARSNAAIAAHDTDGVASVMDLEYVGLSSRDARTVGRQAARADYATLFATRPGVVFVRTPRSFYINALWGQAGEIGDWTGRWSSADGKVRVGGKYFAKWRTVGGQWRLLAETFVQTMCTGASYCNAPPVVGSPH